MRYSSESVAAKRLALWFIRKERKKIVHNYSVGSLSRDQAVGGLYTLLQIASYIHDVGWMRRLSATIAAVRGSAVPGLLPGGTAEAADGEPGAARPASVHPAEPESYRRRSGVIAGAHRHGLANGE